MVGFSDPADNSGCEDRVIPYYNDSLYAVVWLFCSLFLDKRKIQR